MQGPGRLHRAVLVARPHPDGPHRLLSVRRVRRSHPDLRPRARPGRDVENRKPEGEADRVLRVVARQPDAQRAAPPLVVDHHGQLGLGPVAQADHLGIELDRGRGDRRRPGPLRPVPGRLDLEPPVGGGHGERPVGQLSGRGHRGAQLQERGAFRAGRHPQLGRPDRTDLPFRFVPGEPHAPVAVARAVVDHDVEFREVAVRGAQRAGFQPQPDRHLDRRGRGLLDQPHDGTEAVVGRVRVRADGQVALGTLTCRGRRRRDLHVHGRTAVRWRFDHLGVEGEPDDPFVVGAGHRVAPRVVAAAVVEVHGEPPVHRVLHADDGRLGPDPGRPADSRDHQRDLGLGVHALVALGSQAQPQPERCATTSAPGRTSKPIRTAARSPGSSLVSGTATVSQGGGATSSTRYPSTIDDGLVSCSSTLPRRAPSRTTSPSGTVTFGGSAVGFRSGVMVVGRRSGVAGTRSPMIAVAAGSADAVAAVWRWSGGWTSTGLSRVPPEGPRPVAPLRGRSST